VAKQVSEWPSKRDLYTDAALSRLDPADLGTVAFQDAGSVVKPVAQAFAVPAQGRAEQPPPYGGRFYHGAFLSVGAGAAGG
jgi:hypothetical protein